MSSKKITLSGLKPFFDAFMKDCTEAELKYGVPSVVLLALAAHCSGINTLPAGNNLFRFRKSNSCGVPEFYNCTADSVFHFAHFITRVIDFNGCTELKDVCNRIIDSVFADCFLDDRDKAREFCDKALPVFFDIAFDPDGV
ncbi:MAG TPA: hypothetical protein PKY46_14220 [Ignavibacteriaceae bacterium]|nr:hypothetical protein [Ignavibacteriaceae bacterium]